MKKETQRLELMVLVRKGIEVINLPYDSTLEFFHGSLHASAF
jgi:hypothetical protein